MVHTGPIRVTYFDRVKKNCVWDSGEEKMMSGKSEGLVLLFDLCPLLTMVFRSYMAFV